MPDPTARPDLSGQACPPVAGRRLPPRLRGRRLLVVPPLPGRRTGRS